MAIEDDKDDVDLFFCALIHLFCLFVPMLTLLVYPTDVADMMVTLFWPIPSVAYILIYRKVRKDYRGENKREIFRGHYPSFATLEYRAAIIIVLLTLLTLYVNIKSLYWPG